MSGPVHCTDTVDSCNECPRYMDDCDGDEEHMEDEEESTIFTTSIGKSKTFSLADLGEEKIKEIVEQLAHLDFGDLKPRDPKRIDKILQLIGFIWAKHPDQRLFQLLTNYTSLGKSDKTGYINDPFYVEDDDYEEELIKVFKEMK